MVEKITVSKNHACIGAIYDSMGMTHSDVILAMTY
jgi:hypothetical protein